MIHPFVLIVDTNTGLAPFFGGPLWHIGWGDTSFDINAFKADSKQKYIKQGDTFFLSQCFRSSFKTMGGLFSSRKAF